MSVPITTATAPALELRNFSLGLRYEEVLKPLVHTLNVNLPRGTITGLVGESGSGKSLTARALMGLLPAEVQVRGEYFLAGEAAHQWSAQQWHQQRGRKMAMIFQDPLLALNPLRRVGSQLAEVWHRFASERQFWFQRWSMQQRQHCQRLLCEALERVRLHDPEAVLRAYPHQLSGGMRQRVMIAMSLLGRPSLLLADEPTAALDAGSRGRVLQELLRARSLNQCAVLLISHDLSIVEHCSDQVLILYGGRLLEQGPTAQVLSQPRHPYTAALAAARPRLSRPGQALSMIPGQFQSQHRELPGCVFAPRCALAQDRCRQLAPRLQPATGSPLASGSFLHHVACHFPLGPAREPN